MTRAKLTRLCASYFLLVAAGTSEALHNNGCSFDAIQRQMQPLLKEKSADFAGEADFWQKPDALYVKGQGKEEDIVLAKFVHLVECGYSPAQLEIVYVLDTRSDAERVLLAYYPLHKAEPLLLDALTPTAKLARYYPYYRPISTLSKNRIERLLKQDPNALDAWLKKGE